MADEHKDEHGEGHSGGGHKRRHSGPPHGGGSHEEHEGAPEWLISFADNVALMMGFFVILLAMNMQKPSTGGIGGEGKQPADDPPEVLDAIINIRNAFHAGIDMNSTNPNEAALRKRIREKSEEGGESRQPGVNGKDKDVQAQRTGNFVQPCATVFFSADFETTINDEGKQAIRQIATNELKGKQWIIEVRGHVSALEARKEKDGGYLLGFKRAQACVEELIAAGVSPALIRATSCKDNERATPRAASAQGHQNNQRAEVVVTQEQAPSDPYSASSSSRGGAQSATAHTE